MVKEELGKYRIKTTRKQKSAGFEKVSKTKQLGQRKEKPKKKKY